MNPSRHDNLSPPGSAGAAGTFLRGMFLDEAAAHLSAVESALFTLGRAQDPPVLVRAAAEMLRHLHTLKGAAGSVGLDQVGDAAHELEELAAEIHDQRLVPTIGVLERLDESLGTLGALLEGARDVALLEDVPSAAGNARAVPPTAVEAAPAPGAVPVIAKPPATAGKRAPAKSADRSLRIRSAHLESLQDGVGDLVILRTRIERRLREFEGAVRDLGSTRTALHEAVRGLATPDEPSANSAGHRVFLDRMGEIEHEFGDAGTHLERATRALGGEVETLRRLTAQIDHELRRARKVPLDWAFQRLPHTLRDLERTTGRHVDLQLSGGDIEVDKTLADQVAEALLHLLRNALAHGIETPAERIAAGKSPRGRIEVTAREEGEFVFVTFADDGRGLDRHEIRRALIRRGRLTQDAALPAQLPESVLLAAIFEAGFSSRPVADRLAGRGLGLNIVKRAAVRMGGDVVVEDTPGRGTRFTISAPNQGAITMAVLFKVGGQVYAIPAAHVEKAQAVPHHEPRGDAGSPIAAPIPAPPVLCLQSLFGAEAAPGPAQAALHVRYGGHGFVLTCDKIIGPRTIVVRPLGPILAGLPLYAGVTVSGSGKAQLVLDVAALSEAAQAPAAPIFATSTQRVVPRILVVDDSRLQRETTARTLLGAGLSPVVAEDGMEAWELLTERRFDALVTDLEMPRLDGFDLIARVRQEPSLKDLPIVVVSSRTAHAPRQRALSAGADAILPKGPHRKLLLDTLTALLARSGSGPAPRDPTAT
jgi:chemosensory pili system protein ChpA (sensor histidine kinase/response regulator)